MERPLSSNTSLTQGGRVEELSHICREPGRTSNDRLESQRLRTPPTVIDKYLEPVNYTTLPTSRSIRLLEILPVAVGMELPFPQERVRCRMKTVSLDDNPCFTALSYTWGDPIWRGFNPSGPEYDTRSYEIECDGRAIKVHKNLHDVLLQLRLKISSIVSGFKENQDRNKSHQIDTMLQSLRLLGAGMCHSRYWEVNYIWVDAICINQQDLSERGAQVSIMGDIYRGAQNVLVWLGPHDMQTEEAVRVCSWLVSIPPQKWPSAGPISDPKSYHDLGIQFITQRQWEAYVAFAQRSWFSRAWILQEAVLALHIVVLHGPHEIPWINLVNSFSFLDVSGWNDYIVNVAFSTAVVGQHNPNSPDTMTDICGRIPRIANLRRRECRTEHGLLTRKILRPERDVDESLWGLLTAMRWYKAQDPRDLVYATLGILNTPIKSIIPNYNKPASEVYVEAAWAILDETENLFLLHLVEDFSQRKMNGLPSWVPDWSARLWPNRLPNTRGGSAVGDRWYSAGYPRWIKPVGISDLRRLTVSALQIDSVLASVKPHDDLQQTSGLYKILELAADYLSSTSRGILSARRSGVLWRTLIANTHQQKSATESHGRLFRDWVVYILWGICRSVSNTSPPELISVIERTRLSLAKLTELDESVPDTAAIDVGLQTLKSGRGHSIALGSKLFSESVTLACVKRRLFRTSNGCLGVGSESLRSGDQVFIATGSDVPLILRPVAGELKTFRFVGVAYVHGIMHGEALEFLLEGDASFEDITLV